MDALHAGAWQRWIVLYTGHDAHRAAWEGAPCAWWSPPSQRPCAAARVLHTSHIDKQQQPQSSWEVMSNAAKQSEMMSLLTKNPCGSASRTSRTAPSPPLPPLLLPLLLLLPPPLALPPPSVLLPLLQPAPRSVSTQPRWMCGCSARSTISAASSPCGAGRNMVLMPSMNHACAAVEQNAAGGCLLGLRAVRLFRTECP